MANQYTQTVTDKRFTILLEEDIRVDPRKFGDVVAPALGVTKVEARMAVRKGRGVFLENLPEDQARRIADELSKDAIRSRVFAADELPALPAPRKITALEYGDELLTYAVPGTGERESVLWEALVEAHVGVVAKPEFKELFGHVPF